MVRVAESADAPEVSNFVPIARVDATNGREVRSASRVLANGLHVHALEAHHAPVVSLWIWYRVGGRNEHAGTRAFSHFLEHMLFTGTVAHPHGTLDRMLASCGGHGNAFTTEDFTAYYETLPIGQYRTALALEADRMRGVILDASALERVRRVILDERRENEARPSYLLLEAVQGVAFDRHPYGQTVIGTADEIALVAGEKLGQFYDEHYTPPNSFVVAVGDAPADALIGEVESAFSHVHGPPTDPVRCAPEPRQRGERRVHVSGPPNVSPLVYLAYRAPAANDPLAPGTLGAMVALAGTGSSSESISGRSSRLYRTLVERGLAVEVETTVRLMKEPWLFWMEATLAPDADPEPVEDVMRREADRLARSHLGDEEFERVHRQLLSAEAYRSTSMTGRAYRLGQLFATEAANSLEEWRERLFRLTPRDIQTAAREVFREDQLTVGWLTPAKRRRRARK